MGETLDIGLSQSGGDRATHHERRPGRDPRAAPHNPRYQRTAVLLPAVIQDGEHEVACQVLNISASGALVRVPDGAAPADQFTMRIEPHQTFRAQVVRKGQGDQWGVAFFDNPRLVQMVIDQILSDSDRNRDLRRFPRRRVMLAGSFYLGDQFTQCRIHNLSVGGAFLNAPVRLCPGHGVGLRIDRFGTMPARVVWFSSRGMGMAFADEPAVILDRIGHLLPPPPRSSL